MLQRNSLALKILSVFLAFGIAGQSFAQTIKLSEKEKQLLEQQYKESSDYTVPVVATIAVIVAAATGYYFLGADAAVSGAAVVGMGAAKKHVTDSPAKMARLLDEANRFINSPKK